MIWNFTKMHGLGNDFVMLDGVRQSIDMTPQRARALAHRQFGIGCDQILLVDTPHHPEADFRYRIFNADGGEVEHCGNGARCFVKFVHEQKLSSRNPLRAEIATGLITLEALSNGDVVVDMGQTRFTPADLPFDVTGLATRTEGTDTLYGLPLHLNGAEQLVWLSAVAISNPHAAGYAPCKCRLFTSCRSAHRLPARVRARRRRNARLRHRCLCRSGGWYSARASRFAGALARARRLAHD